VAVTRGVVHVKGKPIVGTPKTRLTRAFAPSESPPQIFEDLGKHLRDHVAPGPEALLFPARHDRSAAGRAANPGP
jgi:hypothetical protein